MIFFYLIILLGAILFFYGFGLLPFFERSLFKGMERHAGYSLATHIIFLHLWVVAPFLLFLTYLFTGNLRWAIGFFFWFVFILMVLLLLRLFGDVAFSIFVKNSYFFRIIYFASYLFILLVSLSITGLGLPTFISKFVEEGLFGSVLDYLFCSKREWLDVSQLPHEEFSFGIYVLYTPLIGFYFFSRLLCFDPLTAFLLIFFPFTGGVLSNCFLWYYRFPSLSLLFSFERGFCGIRRGLGIFPGIFSSSFAGFEASHICHPRVEVDAGRKITPYHGLILNYIHSRGEGFNQLQSILGREGAVEMRKYITWHIDVFNENVHRCKGVVGMTQLVSLKEKVLERRPDWGFVVESAVLGRSVLSGEAIKAETGVSSKWGYSKSENFAFSDPDRKIKPDWSNMHISVFHEGACRELPTVKAWELADEGGGSVVRPMSAAEGDGVDQKGNHLDVKNKSSLGELSEDEFWRVLSNRDVDLRYTKKNKIIFLYAVGRPLFTKTGFYTFPDGEVCIVLNTNEFNYRLKPLPGLGDDLD